MCCVTLLVILLAAVTQDVSCLRNVMLTVIPTPVQKGRRVELHCSYDLENATLYSVKFYRGTHEFYRYSPSDHPTQKFFKHDKFPQVVDSSMSNATQVVLREVERNLTGHVTCEVTTDVNFITSMATSTLEVIDLPSEPPTIKTNLSHHKYQIGDLLEANCTSPPSSQVIGLSFHVNNDPVGVPDMQQQRKIHGDDVNSVLYVSFLSVSFHLNSTHFQNSQLVITCTGIFKTLYRKTATIQLGVSSEPVPERVTSSNTTPSTTTLTLPTVLFLMYYHIIR